MTEKDFKKAYHNSDTNRLTKYIKKPKVLPTKKFMRYVEKSFSNNYEVYEVLINILFKKYDLTKIVINVIDRDNSELLENILSNDVGIELDEKLIERTVGKGRITMAKAIYEYIYDVEDSYEVVLGLLRKYDFKYNKKEKTIDSFIMALHRCDHGHIKKIMRYIEPNFWDDFALKYASMCNRINTVHKLLLYNSVDPCTDDDYPLRIAMKHGYHGIVHELFKHPLVIVDQVNLSFVRYLIINNCLCVVEKILNMGNDHTISLFRGHEIIELMIKCHNDITYLAIHMGIIDVLKINNEEIKNNLEDYKIKMPYVEKPYALNLDPVQIYKEAMKSNDIDLAKSIKHYRVSIDPCILVECLHRYESDGNTDESDIDSVYDYIYNNELKTYDPTELLIITLEPYNLYDHLFEKIFNIVKDDYRLDYETVYEKCEDRSNEQFFMKERIEDKYSTKKYRKFCLEYIGEWSGNDSDISSGLDDSDEYY